MPDHSLHPIYRITLIALAIWGLSLFAGPPPAAAQAETETVQVPDTVEAVVQIRGMVCSNCAQRMKGALENLDAVDRATVLLDKQRALLTFVGENAPSEKTLQETVKSAGYEFRGAVFAEEQKTSDAGG